MALIRAVAGEKDAGRKLKYFVRGDLGVSYTQFSSLKMSGGVRVNGEAALANTLLKAGDVVEVFWPEDAPAQAVAPEFLPVNVVFESDDFYILDKPAPLPCQCSQRQTAGTLENRLAARFGEHFVFRPLNRLDKGTSGLMCAAKHAHACQLLQKELHTGGFCREYLAVVEGIVEGEFTVDAPITKEDAASVRRVVDRKRGRPSVTHAPRRGTRQRPARSCACGWKRGARTRSAYTWRTSAIPWSAISSTGGRTRCCRGALRCIRRIWRLLGTASAWRGNRPCRRNSRRFCGPETYASRNFAHGPGSVSARACASCRRFMYSQTRASIWGAQFSVPARRAMAVSS